LYGVDGEADSPTIQRIGSSHSQAESGRLHRVVRVNEGRMEFANARRLLTAELNGSECRSGCALGVPLVHARLAANRNKRRRIGFKPLDADSAKEHQCLVTVVTHDRAPPVFGMAHVLPGLQLHAPPPGLVVPPIVAAVPATTVALSGEASTRGTRLIDGQRAAFEGLAV
jgi:hypothetical protein